MLCYRAVSVTRVPAVNDFACTGNSGIMMLIQALDTKQVLQLQYKVFLNLICTYLYFVFTARFSLTSEYAIPDTLDPLAVV